MKVIPFQVPKIAQEAFRLQVDRQPYLYDKLHQHAEIQIMYIVKGGGTLIAGDYVGRFNEGDLFIIGSHQPHVFRNDDAHYAKKAKKIAQAISLYFDENYTGASFWQLNELTAIRHFLSQCGRGFRFEGNTKKEGIRCIELLAQQKGIDRLITFFRLLGILSSGRGTKPLSVVSQHTAYSTREGNRMNNILQFTFKESGRAIYVEEVAAVANLSVEAFCRYFKLRTQKTYTHFLNEVRVSKACQLLIASEDAIAAVANESGFTNLSQFNRTFKRVTGVTPRQYLARRL